MFTNFEAATQDSTTASCTAVGTNLHTVAEKEPNTKDAKPKLPDVKDAQPKLKPGPNNPEEASEFVSEIKKATGQFTQIIHSYEPYKIQDMYSDYELRYYELLVQVEDYFLDASMETVLELVDDMTCKCMRMETERERENQALCKDPRVSSNAIPQPHTIMNKLEALPNFKKFEGGEQFQLSSYSETSRKCTMPPLKQPVT